MTLDCEAGNEIALYPACEQTVHSGFWQKGKECVYDEWRCEKTTDLSLDGYWRTRFGRSHGLNRHGLDSDYRRRGNDRRDRASFPGTRA